MHTPAAGVLGCLLPGKCGAGGGGEGGRPASRVLWPPPHALPACGDRVPQGREEEGARAGCPGRAPPRPPPQRRPPPGKRRASAPGAAARPLGRGGSAGAPRLAPRRHLVEAVFAVGFRLHLHLHQHRVRPRHIAQHGWGCRCRHSRLVFGVRGAAASPPLRPSPGLGEACPRVQSCSPLPHTPRPPAPSSPPPPRQPARPPAARVSAAAPHSSSPTACGATGTPLI